MFVAATLPKNCCPSTEYDISSCSDSSSSVFDGSGTPKASDPAVFSSFTDSNINCITQGISLCTLCAELSGSAAEYSHTLMDRSERVPSKISSTRNNAIPACLHPRAMANDLVCISELSAVISERSSTKMSLCTKLPSVPDPNMVFAKLNTDAGMVVYFFSVADFSYLLF